MFQFQKFTALVVFLFSVISLNALSPEWLWATQATGSGGQMGDAITTDAQGNLYLTGLFQGSSVFGATTLNSNGECDAYVAKMDTNGNWLWATRAGGSSSDNGYDITLDAAGNVFVTGNFRDTATFGSTSLTSIGPENIFVAKLDNNGNWLWASQAGSIYGATGRAIALDSANNVIVSGQFSDMGHFGDIEITAEGMNDLFVAKLNGNGAWQWAVRAGAGTYSTATALTVDSNNNIFVAGETPAAVSFGSIDLPGVGGFVAKLNAAGSWQWAVRAGGPSFDPRKGIAVDSAGNVYLAGSFYQDVSFGSTQLIGSEYGNSFVAKLSPTQTWLWAKQVICAGSVYCHDMALDSLGNVYIVGEFFSTTTASFGSTALNGNGEEDIYAAKLDSNGNWLWAKQAGGSTTDQGYSICVDHDFNAYITGCFWSATLFYPHYLVTDGAFKAYVAKLSYWVANEDAVYPAIEAGEAISVSPNPFRQVSKISYRVDHPGPVELSVYNLKGEKICSLVKENKGSGEYQAVWNGCDAHGKPVASGVYICRMHDRERISCSRLVLLK